MPRTLHVVLLVSLAASCGGDPTAAVDAASPDRATTDSRADTATLDAPALEAGGADSWQVDGGADLLTADLPPPDLPAPPGCIQGAFQPYFGNFHAHTSYSDGVQTPDDAFQYARDVAKLDIMVVTDHLEQLYLVPPADRYGSCKTAATAQTSATFLASCGFEYGSGFNLFLASTGHNNVFFSPSLFPAIQLDFHDFYKTLVACATCVGQFNHPGDEPYQHWSNFEYHSDADDRITLFELNSSAAWDLFFKALDAGWHVSPMYNQDNHSANWGTANDRRSGVFLSQLDGTALRAAMLDRRTFATYDKNAVVKVMADTVCWMGSVLTNTASVTLSVEATDADAADTFSSITIYGKAKMQLATSSCGSTNPCSATFTIQATQSPYAVARVEQDDGDFLVAAPVWLAP